ncbi:MAG: tetratricopeptide repeat protein [Vicinamibacteria bacterium]|nr:tetratricopeptide repeat protein [Vicinamibacteria bacterium]
MSLSLVAADGSTTHPRRRVAALALCLSACAPAPALPARSAAPPPRPSVAVLGFAEVPGLATLVAESLRADLAGDEGLRVVPADTVAAVSRDIGLATAAAPEPAGAEELRRRLAVTAVVWGVVRASGGSGAEPPNIKVGLRVELLGAAPAREVWSGESSPDELLNALSTAGEAVLKALDRPRPTPDRPHAELPRLPEAARLYATGLELLRAHEPRRAQQVLQRAALLTPEHPLVHAALAEAWEQLGFDRRAGEEAERAHQLAGGLPREDRMLLEALWRRRRHDSARATLIYQGLQRLFPDQPEHALEAVRAQIAAGQRRPAILAIEQLRAAGANDPRLDLAEAEAAHGLGDYARAETAAARAEAAGRARNAPGLVARALVQRALALRDLGRLPAALQATEEARVLFERAGDPGGVAQSLNWRGTIERRFGRLAEARATYEAALAVADAIGDERRATLARNQLAVLLRQQGQLGAARRRHEEVLAAYRKIGDVEGTTIALSSAGWVRRLQGDLEPARALMTEALTLSRQIGHRLSEAIALNTLAWVAFDAGDLAAARRGFEQTLEINRALASERSIAFTLVGLAQAALHAGDLAAARRFAEESLRLRERLGEEGGVAESHLSLAEIELEEGHFVAAEAAASRAADTWRRQGERDAMAWAEAVRALALLGAGREADAEAARARAASLAASSEQARVRLRVGLTDAWMQATTTGRVGAALERIEGLRREAARRGLRGVLLEARWLAARLELRFGRERSGRGLLVAVARDARAAGFLALARRAEHEAGPEQP